MENESSCVMTRLPTKFAGTTGTKQSRSRHRRSSRPGRTRGEESVRDLIRVVNERIRFLEGPTHHSHDFICECRDDTCTQVMTKRDDTHVLAFDLQA